MIKTLIGISIIAFAVIACDPKPLPTPTPIQEVKVANISLTNNKCTVLINDSAGVDLKNCTLDEASILFWQEVNKFAPGKNLDSRAKQQMTDYSNFLTSLTTLRKDKDEIIKTLTEQRDSLRNQIDSATRQLEQINRAVEIMQKQLELTDNKTQ